MSPRPLVSVVVANYNYGRHFQQFFTALAAQTLDLSRAEVILADDGSTDGSPALARSWGEWLPAGRFELLELRHHGLPGPVRNAGFAQARGEYLVYLDPDDAPAPRFLEACLEALESSPRAGLAYADCLCREGDAERLVCAPEFSPDLLRTQNFLTSSPLMRRAVWDHSRGFASNTAYEDWDFWVQAAANGFGGVRAPEPLNVYCLHGGNYSRRAVEQDGPAKARVVLNNPGFFDPAVRAWALSLLRGAAWAVPFGRGLIPRPQDVERLRAIAAGVMAARGASRRAGRAGAEA
ncbi:MAG: glycosyltransferase family A protein [Thermodesulfobacteriota bacterium]